MDLRRSRDRISGRKEARLSPGLSRESRNPPRARGAVGKITSAASVFFVSAACAYCFSRPRKRSIVSVRGLERNDQYRNNEIIPAHVDSGAQAEAGTPIPQDDPVDVAITMPQPWPEFTDSYPIFSTVHRPGRRSRAFFFSLLLHCGFVLLLGQGLDVVKEAETVPIPHESFLVLQLTPPPQSPAVRLGASSAVLFDPALKRTHRVQSLAAAQAADSPPAETADGSEKRSFQLPPPTKPKAEYTLVQRDVRADAVPKASIRVPEAIVWSAQELAARSPIVPGPELGAKLPNATLSLDLPKPAAKVTPRPAPPIAAVAPPPVYPERTITAPVKMNTSDEGNRIPETLSRMTPERSAGHLISVSEIPLPPEALIAIPPISQIAAMRKPDLPAAGAGTQTAGQPRKDAPAGDAAKTGQTGAGKSAVANSSVASVHTEATPLDATKDVHPGTVDDRRIEVAAASPAARKSPVIETATVEGARAADHSGVSDRGAGPGTAEPPLGPGVIRIDRPQTGKPSSVVLGVSSREAYPESVGVLACRIVYTVYVQVGLPKNWILQFCPADADQGTSAARGTVAALDAPWPYRIMRPPVAGLNGDYTLVHGIVDTSGHFERLALVTPDEVAKNELVPALQQWEFRSASRDGQPTAVEILLIIPHRQE